ncbi:MAG TPA: hydroxylamine reductase [Symbiobacteriaceae bacterium]|jgi:hydroxylamine reductase
MHCYQCEQTVGGIGCTQAGACGKDENVQSLQDNLLFALKGIAAYAYHARELGCFNSEVDAFFAEALYATLTNVNFDLGNLVTLNLKAGEMTLTAMEMLKQAHIANYGEMVPVQVPTGTVAGPGILVTGHSLKVLYELLKQTEGTGINVYTHGELLPAHAYPKLKAFSHLKGNVGGSWVDQQEEFSQFPGVIVGTTNCVLLPRADYQDRMFTVGPDHLPGVKHIDGYDYSEIIAKALSLPKVSEQAGNIVLTTGFSDANVLPLAGKILEAVAAGKIKHFFLVGGCDSPGNGGEYYREFVKQTPKDTIVLTLACGKFRFNDLDLGSIDGIPRLLDLGQCNDAGSAVKIAVALAGALNCGVNDLPLTLVLSWMEQKAVAILMGLFALGIKGIYLGPKPPAWITPAVFGVLQSSFDLRLTKTPEADLKEILG